MLNDGWNGHLDIVNIIIPAVIPGVTPAKASENLPGKIPENQQATNMVGSCTSSEVLIRLCRFIRHNENEVELSDQSELNLKEVLILISNGRYCDFRNSVPIQSLPH